MRFLEFAVQNILERVGEILVQFKFHKGGGSTSYEFFSSIEQLKSRLSELPSKTKVIVFEEKQLPIRGKVDENFVGNVLKKHSEGSDWVIVCTSKISMGSQSWYHYYPTNSSKELEEELRDSYCWNNEVACGHEPSWVDDKIVEAIIPLEDGSIETGIY